MSAKKYAIPTPVQFDRLYAGPLDKHEVFDSYSEAITYAQGPISYPGQTIGVKRSGLKEDVYVINQDKSISRLMIQREDIRLVLKKENWIGEVPYEQALAVPYLEATDNCIISLAETVTDPEVVREIVNAKIGDTIQEEGSIRFIARGDKPKVDIPITITIGSVVSAVEIPNNVNDNTNHTVVIAKKDAWVGTKPPYTQDLYVFGVRPDSNGTVGINPDSSFYTINSAAASIAGVQRYSQTNNTVTIAAMNSKPTRDLEILVVWGDEIVVWENSDTFEDFNTSLDLVLKTNEWAENRPYTQTVRVEGLSEYHTGAIGLSTNCTPEEAEAGLSAGLELIEQGNGYVIVEAKDIKPEIDIPIYLTYGSNITIVSSPEYVGEANRHVDTMAYASRWVESPDGWEQTVDVEGITSNSIGTMGLKNGASELQAYNAAVARIKITKVYDNKVVLTATKIRPSINIPLCFVFGRNINIAKYPGVIGKVTVDTNYIAFDDSLINSGHTTLQQLLEYYNTTKIGFKDTVDNLTSTSTTKPLSANMGKKLNEDKINYTDIVDTLYEDDSILNPENVQSNLRQYLPDTYTVSRALSGNTFRITDVSDNTAKIEYNQVTRDISYNTVFIRATMTSTNTVSFNFHLDRLGGSGGLQANTTYLLQVQTNKSSSVVSVYDINPNNIKIGYTGEPFIYGEYTYGDLLENAADYGFNRDDTWVFKTNDRLFDHMSINMQYKGIMPGNDIIAEIRIVELERIKNTWNEDDVLSARMGKFLSNSKINYTDIVDNLSSTNKYQISNSLVVVPAVSVIKYGGGSIDTNISAYSDSNNCIKIVSSKTITESSIVQITTALSGLQLYDNSVYILDIKPQNTKFYIDNVYSSNSCVFAEYIPGSVNDEATYGFNHDWTIEVRPKETVIDIYLQIKAPANTTINSGTFAEIRLFKVKPAMQVLSANMGANLKNSITSLETNVETLQNTKINYTDTVDNLTSTSTTKPLSANMGKKLNDTLTNLGLNNNDIVFKVQSTQPSAVAGKNVIWIKI